MPLGVILKNENVLNEMIDILILDELHNMIKFVPTEQSKQYRNLKWLILLLERPDKVEHLSLAESRSFPT